MFTRIFSSMIAAATLLTAAPALAAEGRPSKEQCSCCSDGSIHDSDHALRQRQAEEAARAAARQPVTEEDPDVRNQSWGG